MSRKAILQLVLPLIGLSVLFCLLAFAPGEKHSQPPLLEMSVILRDGDGGVSTMRKGMEQAAEDLNVELRFLTPAEDNDPQSRCCCWSGRWRAARPPWCCCRRTESF